MAQISFVFGGTRSGKSEYAEKICREETESVVYLATAIPFDDGMRSRIKKHQSQRPQHWETLEIYKAFHELESVVAYGKSQTVLLDCVTVMVSNLMFEKHDSYDDLSQEQVNEVEAEILAEIQKMLAFMETQNKHFVIVSSEVGMGLVAPFKSGNVYRDIVGKANQMIAAEANEVYFVVAGIPMKIK